MSSSVKVLGVPISSGNIEEVKSTTLAAIENKHTQIVFSCANPHSLVTAKNDSQFFNALVNSEIVVADGAGITMLSRLKKNKPLHRITGTDYFCKIMATINSQVGRRVFFFGSSKTVLDMIEKKINEDFPNIQIAGTLSPPFREWSEHENEQFIEAINKSNADILWVGMTAPKQEKWVYKNRNKLSVPIIASIGAVFEFYAGTKPRAPEWMCRFGLEWLHRFYLEPRRMWKRNIISTPLFVYLVIKEFIQEKLQSNAVQN